MFRRKGPSEVEVARENDVKIGITHELSTALKLVQKENIGTEDQTVYSTDTANSVCNCVEAVLLHGLKSKAVTKIASYVGLGHEATSLPSLNFWNFVSRFTHGEVIAQLKHLGQITTEIGLCRAWVRVALNDGLMESYIDAMVSDTKNLEYFYQRTAYLRDREQPGIMQTYMQGLMNFQFKLSYNASVLNEWSYAPLLLAGVIDAKDAPPPVIKPAAQKQKPSKSSRQEKGAESIVEVRTGRSSSYGSRGNADARDLVYNPMEQPKFGQPPDSSYYITSSEFTSKDVEEFKKFSRHMKKPMSECSGSSQVSAPDPPQMNVSPAAYVQKYGVQIGSPSSIITHDSEENKSFAEKQEDGYNFGKFEKNDTSNKVSDQHIHSIDSVIQAQEEAGNSFVSSSRADNEESGESIKDELEESWEEFYKSPVKKFQDDNEEFRKFQRLESINRDAKEEAILSSILDEEPLIETQIKSEISETDCRTENPTDSLMESNNYDSRDFSNIEAEVQKRGVDKNTNEDLHAYDSNETHTRETSELLDQSQKLLNELGIEEKCHADEPGPEKRFEEDIVYENTKATKNKKKSASDRLKPLLSLSPPKSNIVEPELSDAVAEKVDQIKSKDNAEYLSKHRLSLQYASNIRNTDTFGHRKSLPGVLEHTNESDGETSYSIQDHLYDGVPLDDTKDGKLTSPVVEVSSEDKTNEEEDDIMDLAEDDIKRHIGDKRNSVGNNLMMSGRGWSSSFESEAGDTVDAFSPPRSTMSLPITRPKTESFGSLLQNYTPASSLSARSVDDVLSSFPSRKDTVYSPENQGSSVNEDMDFEDFEVVTSTSTDPDPNDEARLAQVSSIANEKGLDAQNFQCKGCSRAVGLIFGKPRVCKFDGGYYCYECHENDEYYIPALIVHNWDFRKHKVAKGNLEFLMDKEEQPYLNIEDINPRVYDHVQEMQDIKGLRIQLTLLKTYLFTCKQSVAEDLRRLVWPRDYLYESTEQYSLADLLQVPSGALASSLRKVIKFATKHVYGCRLCSQKGFICELCNNPKVIYAFELDATYRCPQCKTVFHKDCKTDNRPCPKCQRRMSRPSFHGSSAVVLTPDYDLQSVE